MRLHPSPALAVTSLVAVTLAAATLAAPTVAHAQTSTFDWNTLPEGTPTPIALTNNGLTLTATGPAVGVCDVTFLNFAAIEPRGLIQNYCVTGTATTIQFAFSAPIASLVVPFGLSTNVPTTLGVEVFLGNTRLGALGFDAVLPPGLRREYVEGTATITFAAFDRVVFGPAPDGNLIALGTATARRGTNTVVPEPSTWALVGAGAGALGVVARRRRG